MAAALDPAPVDVVDVTVIAQQLRTCPDVADVHAGRDGSIVAGSPTGPVVGVRVDRSTLVVGVVGHPGADSVRTVRGVRAALTACPSSLPISVSVESRPDP